MLHTVKYGDNSLIVYMLTDVLGRQTYMIRGIKGRHGENRAALYQPMFVVEFEGVENPKAQMHSIREASAYVPLVSVPFDLRKSTISLFMAEVLYRLVRDVQPDSPLFEYVVRSIRALDATQQGVANFHLHFLVGLSRYLGFFPGNGYTDGDWFDIREGLFCNSMPMHGDCLSQRNAQLLERMMDCDADGLASIEMNRSERDDFLNALLDYFNYHLDAVRSVKSVEILRGVFL